MTSTSTGSSGDRPRSMIEPGASRVSDSRVISASPKRTVSGSSMSRIKSRFAGAAAVAAARPRRRVRGRHRARPVHRGPARNRGRIAGARRHGDRRGVARGRRGHDLRVREPHSCKAIALGDRAHRLAADLQQRVRHRGVRRHAVEGHDLPGQGLRPVGVEAEDDRRCERPGKGHRHRPPRRHGVGRRAGRGRRVEQGADDGRQLRDRRLDQRVTGHSRAPSLPVSIVAVSEMPAWLPVRTGVPSNWSIWPTRIVSG